MSCGSAKGEYCLAFAGDLSSIPPALPCSCITIIDIIVDAC